MTSAFGVYGMEGESNESTYIYVVWKVCQVKLKECTLEWQRWLKLALR